MPNSQNSIDAIIIGGGHNGLVCAYYLAKKGLKVHVYEKRSIVGGAAVTEEFHPGFRNSVASYTVSLLNPEIIKDMKLKEYGLKSCKTTYFKFFTNRSGHLFKTRWRLRKNPE